MSSILDTSNEVYDLMKLVPANDTHLHGYEGVSEENVYLIARSLSRIITQPRFAASHTVPILLIVARSFRGVLLEEISARIKWSVVSVDKANQ